MVYVQNFEDYRTGVFPSDWVRLVGDALYISTLKQYEGNKSFYIHNDGSGSSGARYMGNFGEDVFYIYAYTVGGDMTISLDNTVGGTFHNHIAGIGIDGATHSYRIYEGDGTWKTTTVSSVPFENKWTRYKFVLNWVKHTFVVFVDTTQIGNTYSLANIGAFNSIYLAVGGMTATTFFDYIKIYDSLLEDMLMPPDEVGKLGAVAKSKNIKSYKRTLGNLPLETKYVSDTSAQQSFTAVSDIRAIGVFLTADEEVDVRVGIYTISGTKVAEREFSVLGNDKEEFLFDFGKTINLTVGNDYYFKVETTDNSEIEFGYDMINQMLFSIYSEANIFVQGEAGKNISDIATSLHHLLDTYRWSDHGQIYIDSSGTIVSDLTSAASITWNNTEQHIMLDGDYRELSLTALSGDISIGTSSGYHITLEPHQTVTFKEDYISSLYISGSSGSELTGTLYKGGLIEA